VADDLFSRRRLLQLGTVGVTTGIAGCSFGVPDDSADNQNTDNQDPPSNDTKPDGDNQEPPENPAVEFHAPAYTYSLFDLDRTTINPDPANRERGHKDNTLFTIEVSDSHATATLEQTNVIRDFELRLYIRNADGEFEELSQTLEATEADTPETREIEYDLSNITLPRNAGSICELVAVDHEFDPEYQFLIKRHQFVGVTHKNGVNWVNAENLNYTFRSREEGFSRRQEPKGVTGDVTAQRESPAGYVEFQDDDNERTVFLVTRTPHNGEVFGVSCHINHDPYQDYVNGSENYVRHHNMDYECRYATRISHLQELARKTDDVISEIGVTGQYERIQVLGDMVQMIPYGNNIDDNIPPTVVLYDMIGDCSNKTGLISGILQNDPWNMTIGLIDCDIGNINHWTAGIDVNELGDFDTSSSLLVEPTDSQISDGYPDTSYAFFDMTFDSDIGEQTDGVSNVNIYDVGDFEHQGRTLADDPPDY
jgi:hypothetical protein